MFSGYTFIRFFISYQTLRTQYVEHEWTSFDAIDTSGLWDKGMKWLSLGSGGQRSRSHKAKYRFWGLLKASFSTDLGLGQVAILHRVPKKPSPSMFDNKFGRCGPIFKILSPGDL